MSKKIKIRILILGSVPHDLNIATIKNYSSDVFEICSEIETYDITIGSDGNNWEFFDQSLEELIPEPEDEDITIALTNVPLEDNWYTRRLSNNVIIFTLQDISDYLRFYNIPLENVVLRLLYSYSLVFKEYKNKIPTCREYGNFTHDETKGCIYDMNGIKSDIVYSCDNPMICDSCTQRLYSNGVSRELVASAAKELKNIRKPLFYRCSSWVAHHPICSIAIASVWSLLISILSSVIVTVL